MQVWRFVLFGWPAAVLAFGAFAAAFVMPRAWLGFVGAVIAAPFCWNASGYPLFYWLALTAIGANFLAAWHLHRGRPDRAFSALLPFMLLVAVLAVFAFRDIRLIRG